jgi:hypothetical protein
MTGGEKTEWTLSRRFLLGASVTSVAGLIASQRASPASIVKDDPNLPPYGIGTKLPLFGLSFGFVHPDGSSRCMARGGSSITMGLSMSEHC